MTNETALITTDLPLPPILNGQATPLVEERVRKFLFSVAAIYETWLRRRTSPHTRRSYDQDVMNFVRGYLRLDWPDDAAKLLHVSVQMVQSYRDHLVANDSAPKTVNRRISSLSGFYKYLAASAAELRLPIIVPNPAHSQFIPRTSSDPVTDTKALTTARARQLISMPSGDSILDHRDRAILKFYIYSGARLAAGCHLTVADFNADESGATVRLREKGDRRRTIGLHVAASQAIEEYIAKAGFTSGPLFLAQLNSRSETLGKSGLKPLAMYRLLLRYLLALPNSTREVIRPDGSRARECIYSPHSLRATAATLLLDAGVDIVKVQDLLGHRQGERRGSWWIFERSNGRLNVGSKSPLGRMPPCPPNPPESAAPHPNHSLLSNAKPPRRCTKTSWRPSATISPH